MQMRHAWIPHAAIRGRPPIRPNDTLLYRPPPTFPPLSNPPQQLQQMRPYNVPKPFQTEKLTLSEKTQQKQLHQSQHVQQPQQFKVPRPFDPPSLLQQVRPSSVPQPHQTNTQMNYQYPQHPGHPLYGGFARPIPSPTPTQLNLQNHRMSNQHAIHQYQRNQLTNQIVKPYHHIDNESHSQVQAPEDAGDQPPSPKRK